MVKEAACWEQQEDSEELLDVSGEEEGPLVSLVGSFRVPCLVLLSFVFVVGKFPVSDSRGELRPPKRLLGRT